MKGYKVLTLIGLLTLILPSCYKDRGNYTYDESITDIKVSIKSEYRVRRSSKPMVIDLTPEVKTPDGSKSYLSYKWVGNTESDRAYVYDTYGDSETLQLRIDPNDQSYTGNYYLKLYVTDTRYGTETMVNTSVIVVPPFLYSWMVLHEDQGHAELGSVEYIGGDAQVDPRAYSALQGKSLAGKPLSLSVRQVEVSEYDRRNFSYVAHSQLYLNTTDPKESGLINQNGDLKLQIGLEALVPKPMVSSIDFSQFRGTGGDGGMIFLSNGKVYRSVRTSPFCIPMVRDDQTFQGDFYISKAFCGPHTAVGYDRVGHRFVHLNMPSIGYNPWEGIPSSTTDLFGGKYQPIRSTPDNAADPNTIPANQEVIHMLGGYQYEVTGIAVWQKLSTYAYAIDDQGKSHVYVFRFRALTSDDGSPLAAYYTFDTPAGVTKDTPMTASSAYNNILFYAVGNKVYKLDFTNNRSTMIYEYPDASAEVTALRMGIEGYAPSSWSGQGESAYGHSFKMMLGVGVRVSSDKGALVVLNLDNVGRVDQNSSNFPSVQTYEGFGPVKDIAFI